MAISRRASLTPGRFSKICAPILTGAEFFDHPPPPPGRFSPNVAPIFASPALEPDFSLSRPAPRPSRGGITSQLRRVGCCWGVWHYLCGLRCYAAHGHGAADDAGGTR
jgi:hypothetical protein